MSDKIRVYEVAEEAGASSQEVISKAKDLGIYLKSPQSAVSFEEAEEITNYIMTGKSTRIPKTIKKKKSIGTDGLTNIEKINIHKIKPTKYKAIPRNKVKIVTKWNQKNINLVESKENTNISEVLPDELHEIKTPNKLIPKNNSGNKQKIIINRYPNVIIEIHNLKSIAYLKWELQKEKGVYGIIGENGTGKSSLLICIAKLVNGSIFQNELVGVGHYNNTKITYIINDKKINFIKNESTNNHWRQEKTDSDLLPDMDGFFESSILSGKRFNKLNNYIKKELEYIPSEDSIQKADKFIIDEMNYILYGNDVHLYRFNELYEINAIRKHKNDIPESKYNYYALKINNNRYLKEQIFSTGEYFLLQILKYINKHVNKQHKVSPLIIIDEIELSLHPLAQERFVKKLKSLCKEYNLIVIFASHSLHVIDNIEYDKRYYIERNQDNQITIENPVDIGYLTTKLYKHQFYDYILLVEDVMAQEYVKLTIQELSSQNLKYDIISIGTCDKVMEMARVNSDKKYFGEAKVLPIVDNDKIHLLNEYRNTTLGGIAIPVPRYIEAYLYPIFIKNDTNLRKRFSNFISKTYPPNDLDSLKYIWDKKQNEKNTYYDICYKIAEKHKPTSQEHCKFIADEVKLKIVSFVYEECKNTHEHIKFIQRLKKFFKSY